VVGGINPEIGGKRSGVGGIPGQFGGINSKFGGIPKQVGGIRTIQLKEQPRMEEKSRLPYKDFLKKILDVPERFIKTLHWTLESRFGPLIKKTKPSTFFIRK
jgi:hypothetical protein